MGTLLDFMGMLWDFIGLNGDFDRILLFLFGDQCGFHQNGILPSGNNVITLG